MRSHHRLVPPRAIVPVPEKSLNSKDDDNLIIHGDNLHALKALLPKYGGRVNCIYIDPPYNTGNEGWVYNDNVNSPMLREWLGKIVGSDDMERHSKWLCMMWPRLQLLRELLAEEGVIFISIDYNEEHRLRLLMDEVFGENNYRNTIVVSRVKKNIQEREKVKALNFGYNSVLLYGKSEGSLVVPPAKIQKKAERWHAFDAPGVRPSMEYELFGTKPPVGRHWMFVEERASQLIEYGRLRPNPRSGKPQYRLDPSDRTLLDTNWTDLQEYDSKFNFPNGEKNTELLKRLISMVGKKNAIVLDSFAGSGTTAHAILELNKQDGGDRKFILVECEDYADSITAERVRRVIKGMPDAKNKSLREGTGGSFTYCELGDAIDAEEMLGGKGMPGYSELAAYLLYLQEGAAAGAEFTPNEQGMFHQTDDTDYYLLYKPDRDFMLSAKARLSAEQALAISNQDRRTIVFAADSELSDTDLRNLKIEWVRLPYELDAAR